MKKFLLINSLAGGGAERQVSYIVNGAVIDKIWVLQDGLDYEIKDGLIEKITDNKSRLMQFFSALIYLKKNLSKDCLLLSFLELSNLINIVAKIFFSHHKAIISVRISPSYYRGKIFGWAYLLVIKILYPEADCIITNSFDCKTELIDLLKVCPDKVEVIMNAVNVDKIKKEQEVEIPNLEVSSKRNLVIIGRLAYQKNIHNFLDVFLNLMKGSNLVRLLLIGDGEQKNDLIQYATRIGLKVRFELQDTDGDVYFLGFKKNPYAYLKGNSIFVLPSLYEGLPNALIEALACNRVCVSADCPTGPFEILIDKGCEYGLLLPLLNNESDSKSRWSKSISELLGNDAVMKSFMEKASFRVQRYHLPNVVEKWRKVMDN